MAFFEYDFSLATIYDKISKEDIISVIENNRSEMKELETKEDFYFMGFSNVSFRLILVRVHIFDYTVYPLIANLPRHETTIKKLYCKAKEA